MKPKTLIDFGDKLFKKREPLMHLCNELALNFYPERADFISDHEIGKEFGSHLMDSFPVQARSELASNLSAGLRPRGRPWYGMKTQIEEVDNNSENKQWMERQTQSIRRSMYNPAAKFIRATREGDNDYVTFGQAVLSVEENSSRTNLLYRSWHFRDCVWMENPDGDIDQLHRKTKMTARVMKKRFGEKLHPTVQSIADKEPDKTINVRHVVMPADEYGKPNEDLPFVSVYIDADNTHLLEESHLPTFNYIVPRWHTLSNSVYAFSPAAIISLPDARFAQMLSTILIEAGEKAIDPPAVAIEEAIKSDIDLFSGGITYIDAAYDERLGDPLRYLDSKGNFQLGIEFRTDIREMLSRAWFLNKLNLPLQDRMTAFEVNERIKEFVRGALPLFEPMETDYNPQLLNKTYDMLQNMGSIDFESMPDALDDEEIQFTFISPIQEAEDRIHVSQFSEILQLVGAGGELGATNPINLDRALKRAVQGVGGPSDWEMTEAELKEQSEKDEQQRGLAEAAAVIREGAGVAGDVADATKGLQEAGLV